jgi:hypothetical protein
MFLVHIKVKLNRWTRTRRLVITYKVKTQYTHSQHKHREYIIEFVSQNHHTKVEVVQRVSSTYITSKWLSTNSLTPPSSHNSQYLSPFGVKHQKRTQTYIPEEEGGGEGASGRGCGRRANTSWGSESVSDPGSAVEAGAGTDSDGGCAAGAVGAEDVIDTAITAVVTSGAGGTGGWVLTELMIGDKKTRVTGRSGEEEGPTEGGGGPTWMAGTIAAWRGGGGADWTRGIWTPVCWRMWVMNARCSALSARNCCCSVSCLSWIVWNRESILSDICCWTATWRACSASSRACSDAIRVCYCVRVWRIASKARSTESRLEGGGG